MRFLALLLCAISLTACGSTRTAGSYGESSVAWNSMHYGDPNAMATMQMMTRKMPGK